MKAQKSEKEMDGCTFKPDITPQSTRKNSSKSKRRNLDEFLHDQELYEEKKMYDISIQKEEIQHNEEKELLFRPSIDPISRQLIEKTRHEEKEKLIYDRLYQLSKKEKEHPKSHAIKRPIISLRSRPVQDLLYEDAK